MPLILGLGQVNFSGSQFFFDLQSGKFFKLFFFFKGKGLYSQEANSNQTSRTPRGHVTPPPLPLRPARRRLCQGSARPLNTLASRDTLDNGVSVFFLFSSLMTLLSRSSLAWIRTTLSRIFSMSLEPGGNCPHRRQAGRRPGSAEKPCMCNLCESGRKAKAIFNFL